MKKITVDVENATLRFPKTKPFFGTIENSILSTLQMKPTETDEFTALNDISLKLYEGEIVGLIGKNGSGKSTLLRTISGIYWPDEGIVRSSGQISLLARLGIGFNVHLTGRENVYLYGSILGHNRSVMDSMMEEVIDFSGLRKYIDQPLRTYSSGMKTRLSFSVASAVKSEILLIDEVLSVGDIEFREKSEIRIKEMVDNAATVLLVSHNLKTLEQICDRIVLIEDGKIKAVGEPKEIVEIYKTTSAETKSNALKSITREVPKRSLKKKLSHLINIFLLSILRLFGLSEWASSAVKIPKFKKEEQEEIVRTHWGNVSKAVKDKDQTIDDNNNKKLNLVILTCVWKRPILTKIVLAHYNRLKEEMKSIVNLELVAVGSEGNQSEGICKSSYFNYYEFKNHPISSKWQHGLEMTRKFNPDAVIIVGSDDIITREIIEFYVEKIKDGYLMIGIKDFFIYETKLRKLIHWNGYAKLNDAHRMDETIGLGRCLARPLLDKINFQIWDGLNLNRNLDGAMTIKLMKYGMFPVAEKDVRRVAVNGKTLCVGHIGYNLKEIGGFAIDIKTKTNLTDFDRYIARNYHSVSYTDGEILSKHLNDDMISEIMELGRVE